MSSPSAQRPPLSHLNVGHHGFAQATGTNGSVDDFARPASRARDPSPLSKRMSSFGLNVLKKRGPQQQQHPPVPDARRPITPSLGPHDVSPTSTSPQGPPRYSPPHVPAAAYDQSHQTVEHRGRTLPFSVQPPPPQAAGYNGSMAELPLPPRIPGGIHTNDLRDRSSSRDRYGSVGGNSVTSSSRPGTPQSSNPNLLQRPSTPGDDKTKKRRTFIGKLHKKSPAERDGTSQPDNKAFYVGPNGHGDPYDVTPLVRGRPVPELWQPQGNLLVYLHGRAPEPSFRLDSSIIASSRGLQELIIAGFRRTKAASPTTHMRHASLGNVLGPTSPRHGRSGSVGSAEVPWSPGMDDESTDIEVRLPFMVDPDDPSYEEVADLITARNMFACLVGQLIVGCHGMSSFFQIFMSVAGMMKRFHFGNFDGSTLGEAAEAAFLGYVADLRLDDVRKSREKTIEALILGERMKCWSLYNEAYVHGVGKWQDMMEKRDPKFKAVSPRTRIAMEKSATDLDNRIQSVREHLNDFQFPALFAGYANSRATKQAVDVQAWENSWKAMRKHILSFYKKAYGNWPPKAKSKKNEFEESGLNRLLLQDVYRDFTDLYDMLVNRDALTERTLDSSHGDTLSDDVTMDHLRKVLSEFDRSLVPVRPPIPFDLPNIPTLTPVVRGYEQMDAATQEKENARKIKGDDFTSVLMNSYNRDALKTTPFIEAYMAWERGIGSGRTINELANIRVGAWVFVYVVLQMLPLVVVDAPGLRHTRGVEYFLCEIPKGSPPWMPEQKGAKAYYRIAGTGGVVSMPADVVEHGVEGIFRRSHCWVAASRWTGQDPAALIAAAQPDGPAATHPGHAQSNSGRNSDNRSVSGQTHHSNSDFGEFAPPPPMVTADGLLTAGSGPSSGRASRNSLLPGLEALPLPPSIAVDPLAGSRRQSVFDPTKSFDDILSGFGQEEGKKGKKGKK